MITIENKKVHDLIVLKDKEVENGRKISRDIEVIEIKIKRFEDREKKITAKVSPPKELTDRGDEVAKQIGIWSDELDKIAKQINDSKLEAVPLDMKNDHLKLLKDKESLERERNKIALRVQKIKDKIIPVIQREVKPLLQKKRLEEIDMGRFDDIGTAKVKDGKIIIDEMNWLKDWITKFGR